MIRADLSSCARRKENKGREEGKKEKGEKGGKEKRRD